MYLIFDTKAARDTLVVIGDIAKGIANKISAPQNPGTENTGVYGYRSHYIFDSLGRILTSKDGYFR